MARSDAQSVCVANSRSIDIWSAATYAQILQIQKKGDYNLTCFDKLGSYIVYSDPRDTQVFAFDQATLKLQKLTQAICASNGLEALPPAAFLKLYDESNLLLVDLDLNVLKVKLAGDFKVEALGSVAPFLPEARSYDRIVNLAHFNSKTGNLFLSFANLALLMLDTTASLKLLWTLPSMGRDQPLSLHADQDKLLVCYDSNRLALFDLLNHRLHDWSKKNAELPPNFLNRFNRIVGITQLTPKKYLLWTHYTYITLNLALEVPSKEATIIQNHPGKSLEERSLVAKSWFDSLKVSQARYLKGEAASSTASDVSEEVANLTISNKLKGILSMEYDGERLIVVENVWKKLVE